MNVRFSVHQIRVRIDRIEFEQLRAGRALVMTVHLPGQRIFQASVAVDRLGNWRLDSDPTGLWLTLPKSCLDQFAGGPTAEGVEHRFELANGGAIDLVFEVDVRS